METTFNTNNVSPKRSTNKEDNEGQINNKARKQIGKILRRAHTQLSNVERTSSEVQGILRISNMKAEPHEGRQLQNLEGKGVRIIINNIAGVNKNNRKLERIIEIMSSNEIDIFLGQEINIKTR